MLLSIVGTKQLHQLSKYSKLRVLIFGVTVTSHNTRSRLCNYSCHLYNFQDSWTPSSVLELSHCQLLTLNIIYSKVLPLVLLLPCHHVLTIHVYFTIIVFLPASCLSPTPHPLHLHFPQLMLCPLTCI